jgi:hypothetical protein
MVLLLYGAKASLTRPLRQEDHRERNDQQDGDASECEGASPLKRHHLARSTPMTGSHGST